MDAAATNPLPGGPVAGSPTTTGATTAGPPTGDAITGDPVTGGAGGADPARTSLGRSSSLIAVASLVSRITGFVRQIVLIAVVGAGVLTDSYTLSNTLPLIVYELLLGGVLSSVMVPLLVRSQTEDADGGQAFTRRLLTMAALALLLATAVAMLAAPLLTRLYLDSSTSGRASPELATALAYLLLPQIFFFGMGALFGAILNSRGAFGAFAWAPVLNNLVVLVMLGVYVFLPGEISIDPVRMGEPKLLALGVGTTLGIVVQAASLLPALRRLGGGFRPLFGWDRRLSQAGGLAVWAVIYVLIGQAGYVVITRASTGSTDGALTAYTQAWLLLQVPYGVLGVSLLTALMPRMSRAAAEGRNESVVADLSLGGRLLAVFLIPVSVLLTVFGPQVGTALFGLRAGNLDFAAQAGAALAASAFGLLPYGITMLQLRVFYALTDSRTPTLIQLFTVAVKIPLMLLSAAVLAPRDVVLGLAAANSAGFIAGAVLGQLLLRRKLGRIPTRQVLSTFGRTLLAAAGSVLVAYGAVLLLRGALTDLAPPARAWIELLTALIVMAPLTVVTMRLLRVSEVNPFVSKLERLVDRRKPRREAPR